VVTKRSGQAQTALISRCPTTVERTRGRHSPRKDQGDNKSSTNRRHGQTDSDWQTKRVKSFGRLAPSGSLSRLGTLSFRSGARHKGSTNQSFAKSKAQRRSFVQDPIRRQFWLPKRCRLGAALLRSGTRTKGTSTKGDGISDAACGAIRRAKATQFALPDGCRQSWSPKPSLLRSPGAPIRDANEGNRHKGSRNQRRGASCESSRETQSEFALQECRRQVMVAKAFPPP
jgi:hypothetical protein